MRHSTQPFSTLDMTKLLFVTRLFFFITTLLLLVTSCNNNGRQDFALIIKHYAGGSGLTIIYDLNENGLKVETNCDLENCKQRVVYRRTFTNEESDNIYSFLNSLKLDTLKSSYETKGIWDGLFTKLTFKKVSSHRIQARLTILAPKQLTLYLGTLTT